MMTNSTLKRRSFLTRGAALAGALALPPVLSQATAGSVAAKVASASNTAWESLQRITQNQLIRPGDAAYGFAITPNNLRFGAVRPQGVATCRSPQMVADVLRWCQDNAMPFVVRGGGHSYAGYSTSPGLLISTAGMQAIEHDLATQQVRVEAGALNGQIYGALQAVGRAITHGRCPGVGVAGFLLGGGIGFNMRRFGMGCDQVVSAQLVTADGRIRQVSANEEPELFWALRGGAGGNFGVSTAFTLKTQPADARLTVLRIVWRQQTRQVAERLFAALDAAPITLGSRVALGGVTPELARQGRQVPVTLLGQFAGSQEDLLALLAPALAVARPDHQDVRETGYWEGQGFLLDPGAPAWYREHSAFCPQAPDASFLDEAFEQLYRWPGTGAASSLFFFQTGGKVNDVAPTATAFVHRDSRWLSVAGITWNAEDNARPQVLDAAMTWQDQLYAVVNRHGGRGAFQNFPDDTLRDWRERYYGANLQRLTAIKAAIDPTQLFRFPQSL